MREKKSSKPARSLGKKDMKKVRGGGKQISGIKYEDITISPPPPTKP